jgi:hypothetical protein
LLVWWPSRDFLAPAHPVKVEQAVVLRQVSVLDIGIDRRDRGQAPSPAQVGGRGRMFGIGDGLVISPTPLMPGEFGTATGDYHVIEIGAAP